jgi:hypothetical protein
LRAGHLMAAKRATAAPSPRGIVVNRPCHTRSPVRPRPQTPGDCRSPPSHRRPRRNSLPPPGRRVSLCCNRCILPRFSEGRGRTPVETGLRRRRAQRSDDSTREARGRRDRDGLAGHVLPRSVPSNGTNVSLVGTIVRILPLVKREKRGDCLGFTLTLTGVSSHMRSDARCLTSRSGCFYAARRTGRSSTPCRRCGPTHFSPSCTTRRPCAGRSSSATKTESKVGLDQYEHVSWPPSHQHIPEVFLALHSYCYACGFGAENSRALTLRQAHWVAAALLPGRALTPAHTRALLTYRTSRNHTEYLSYRKKRVGRLPERS